MLRVECFLAKLIYRNRVVDLARVNLFDARLVLEALPVTFDMLGCARGLLSFILIGLHAVLSTLLGAQSDKLASCFDIGDTIKLAR